MVCPCDYILRFIVPCHRISVTYRSLKFLSQREAERMCQTLKHVSPEINCKPSLKPCIFCGGPTATNSFHILSNEADSVKGMELGELTMTTTEQVRNSSDFP